MPKQHAVRSTDDQRADLTARFAGPLTPRQRNRVPVLLRADAGDTDADIADDPGVTTSTAADVRRRFAADGSAAALADKPPCGGPAKLDGKAEAVSVALACRPAPAGRTARTAARTASALAELRIVESVSGDTVLRVLGKATSRRGGRRAGVSRRG